MCMKKNNTLEVIGNQNALVTSIIQNIYMFHKKIIQV